METSTAPAASGIAPMLTVSDVGALLRKSDWVIHKMARLGQLPGARKIGRTWLFRRNDMQRFVEGKPL